MARHTRNLRLLLLPGMDGTGEMFAPFIAALNGEFEVEVVAYPTSRTLSYEALLASARAAIPQEGEYAILGESFSGPIATALAADASPRLKALVLCCTFVINPRPALSGLRGLSGLLPVGLLPMAVVGNLLFGSFSTARLRAALAHSLGQVPARVLRKRLSEVLTVDVSAELARLQLPLLYLRASRDRLVPASASARIARICPQTEVAEFDAPHSLLQVKPREAARVITEFLRRVQNIG